MLPIHAEARTARLIGLTMLASLFSLAAFAHGQAPCPLCQPQPHVDLRPKEAELPTGVNVQKIKTGRLTINGMEVTQADARRAVSAGIPSDATMPFLVIIGPQASRQRVLADLTNHPILSRLRAKYRVQDYAPDEWLVTKRGFVATGQPTIYVEEPSGNVLLRLDNYSGPDDLARQLTNDRPAPKPAPEPARPAVPSPLALVQQIPPWAYVLSAAGIGVLYLRRKRGK